MLFGMVDMGFFLRNTIQSLTLTHIYIHSPLWMHAHPTHEHLRETESKKLIWRVSILMTPHSRLAIDENIATHWKNILHLRDTKVSNLQFKLWWAGVSLPSKPSNHRLVLVVDLVTSSCFADNTRISTRWFPLRLARYDHLQLHRPTLFAAFLCGTMICFPKHCCFQTHQTSSTSTQCLRDSTSIYFFLYVILWTITILYYQNYMAVSVWISSIDVWSRITERVGADCNLVSSSISYVLLLAYQACRLVCL
jgi:hypothetical protein